MNISEANDLNVVLRWALGLPDPLGVVPTPEQAQRSMIRLADRANTRLGAGVTELDVVRWWANEMAADEAGRGADYATVTITSEDDATDVLTKITRVLDPVNDTVAWSFDARDATPRGGDHD